MYLPFTKFKTFLEGISWDLFELRCHSHFDEIDVRKMGFLQNRFDLKKEKKVTWGQIRGIWGGVLKLQCFFLRETDNIQGCVNRSVIVMECPGVGFPKALPLFMY